MGWCNTATLERLGLVELEDNRRRLRAAEGRGVGERVSVEQEEAAAAWPSSTRTGVVRGAAAADGRSASERAPPWIRAEGPV